MTENAKPDITLGDVAERMRREAPRAEGFGKAVKLDFGDDGAVVLDARQSPPTVVEGDSEADATLRVSLSNFLRMVKGDLDPARAVLTGKLKVGGDMGAALGLAKLFRDGL